MSEIRAKFQVPAGVAPTACCDEKSTRYTMGVALITPAKDGNVFVSATDSRCASVAKFPGTTDKPHYIPKAAIGKGKKAGRGKLPTEAVLNGRWECDGKFVPADDVIGRFPALHQAIPDVEGWDANTVAATINPALLAKLVDALGCLEDNTGGNVTLLMKRRTDNNAPDYDQREVESPIVVLGAHGIGLLMPKDGPKVPALLAQVKELAAEYAETFGQPA